ncbi:helix-hairpin-helix domain-containing protein [Bacillus massilinigeriensis]|uniref:helix-hairpin-helix domain-containing protein n=1 Tax=Bacillus massilionigeriensis TaxID=1805475 RepID=UPI00096AF097|nr:helix-hairpin-helix domain-containing protein [Bacillus massilionigeriensis]
MIEWLKVHKIYGIIGGLAFVMIMYFGFTRIEDQPKEKNTNLEWSNFQEGTMDTKQEDIISDKENKNQKEILVDVKGAVHQPGVYEAQEGERVKDIIRKAGGLKGQADEKNINFAMKVTDEMVLYIPRIGETNVEGSQSQVGSPSSSSGKEKVNLNTADEAALQTLPSIGPSRAAAIIEYREKNGPFKSIEDLKSISGIGDKTFEKLEENISVH